mgnify:CR=1 FL=1
MPKKKITLPDFKSIDEMAEFFDKTDTTLIDGFEEVDIKFVKAKGTTKEPPRRKIREA